MTRLRRARVAIAIIFFADGAIFGSWVSRIPAIKDNVDARTGPLGLALLGIAVGALLSRQVAGQLVVRMGSRFITRVGIASFCVTLPLPALTTNVTVLGLALIGFGVAVGVLDVAMNANAVAVQSEIGRPVMSSFHGTYSVGGLTGAVGGGRATAAGVSPLLHFTLVAVTLGLISLVASSWLLSSAGAAAPKAAPVHGWAKLPRQYRLALFLLGFVGLCSMVGEGAAGDWGAIYLHDNLGTSLGFASSGFAAYSIAMAAGRLLDDRFVSRWGGLQVITWSAAFAGTCFALALLIGNPVVAICGFTALGLGLSAVIPVTFSMAGHLGEDAAGPAITVVSSIAVTGSLAGPPVIGFVAEVVGLPAALGLVSVLAFVAAGLVRVIKPMRESSPAERSPTESLL